MTSSRLTTALLRSASRAPLMWKSAARTTPTAHHCSRLVPIRSVSSSAQHNDNNEPYDSPLQELFDRMERNVSVFDGSSLSEPSSPPSRIHECGIPESSLRFTTTTYGRTMNAPFVQPKEHAVTMKVNIEHLPLNELELELLREVVGNRLKGHELRLQSNQFGSRMENKRHLVSQLDRVVMSCKRLAKEINDAQSKMEADAV